MRSGRKYSTLTGVGIADGGKPIACLVRIAPAPTGTGEGCWGNGGRQQDIGDRANRGEVRECTTEALLAWTRSKGLFLPDYIRVIPFGADDGDCGFPVMNDRPVDAKYFEAKKVPEAESIYWDEPFEPYRSVFNREFGAAVVNVAYTVMQNDERFLHVVAHQVSENGDLKKLFEASGGKMSASRFYELTEPLQNVQNLHWHAWEYADSLIERVTHAICIQ